jgi:hypothetical protein
MKRSRESETEAKVGSFAEAERFRLLVALTLSHAERLRDLEAMWDFNDMIETKNPRIRLIAERLRQLR